MTPTNSMSDEGMRVAVAEVCGWVRCAHVADLRYGKYKDYCDLDRVPNFPRDLNACADMEKVLTEDDADTGSRWRYIQELIEITKAESMEMHREVFVVAHATAHQRCTAFLLTLGKYDPTK